MSNKTIIRIKCIDGDDTDLAVNWTHAAETNCVARIEAPFKIADLDLAGIAALRAALDKAEAAHLERIGEDAGSMGEACEPSTRDRLFYKPQSFTMSNGEVRHFSPPAPFEPCPGAGLSPVGGKVVKATHPEPLQGKMSAPSEMKDLPRDVEAIAAEMKRLAMMPKVGAVEPMPDIPWLQKEWPTLGGKETIRTPRYHQLTDWVRAQPEGAILLAVFHEDEPIPAVAAHDARGKRIDDCREYALHARMMGGHGYTAVWLSREVDSSCEGRIPQGVSVYREGT
jgi:hypothetical protein